jgi:hypothetical protein
MIRARQPTVMPAASAGRGKLVMIELVVPIPFDRVV